MKRKLLSIIIPIAIFVLILGGCSEKNNPVKPTQKNPAISSILPDSGKWGEQVQIIGKDFGAQRDTNYIEFNGTACALTDYISWNDTLIKVNVPDQATSGNVTIYVAGKASNGVNFKVLAAAPLDPYIVSLNPIFGELGDVVELHGRNFGDSRGTNFVTFNGFRPQDSDYYLWTDTLIKTKVPQSAKTGTVAVNINNIRSNDIIFTIIPQITSLSPTTAKIGEQLIIFGNHFGDEHGSSIVTLNGVQIPDINIDSWIYTKIILTIPDDANSGELKVTVNNVESNSINFTIKVDTKVPQISSINPTSAKIGDEIQIIGKNFGFTRTDSYVDFNGTVASSTGYNLWTDTLIKVKVPTGTTTGKVTVNVGGTASNGVTFTVEVPVVKPVITSLDVNSSLTGELIQIFGKNFGSSRGTNYVTFNGVKAASDGYKYWDTSHIIVFVPEGATSGNVIVNVNGEASNGVLLVIEGAVENIVIDCVEIPDGSFFMGSDKDEFPDDNPVHEITISKPFLMSKFEITQKIWGEVFLGSNPSYYKNPENPVEQLDWFRAVEFCNELSSINKLTPCYTITGSGSNRTVTCNFNANGYRLPTEAEWEYACRAGTTGDYNLEDDINNIAWTLQNSGSKIKPVGQKKPNAWGLYDMHGNVAEWCWDWYDSYSSDPQTDPTGPSDSYAKVVRGGSAQDSPSEAMSWVRWDRNVVFADAKIGFRVVRKK